MQDSSLGGGFPDIIELANGWHIHSSVIDPDGFHVAGDERSGSHGMRTVSDVASDGVP